MFKHLGWHSSPVSFCTLILSLFAARGIAAEFFVSPLGSHEPPFASWQTASTNIQAAIDAAAASDVVWVTNGVYDSGGKKSVDGQTNRVLIDKALTVASVNGPHFTTIKGEWDPQINGPLAIRCAWLTNEATLKGFTLYSAATTATSYGLKGGGAYGVSRSATLINCVLATNSASSAGGGAAGLNLKGCTLVGNEVVSSPGIIGAGGGAVNCLLDGCRVFGNRASVHGGGISDSTAQSCVINGNEAGAGIVDYRSGGGGVYSSVLLNCTVVGNLSSVSSYQPAGAAVRRR